MWGPGSGVGAGWVPGSGWAGQGRAGLGRPREPPRAHGQEQQHPARPPRGPSAPRGLCGAAVAPGSPRPPPSPSSVSAIRNQRYHIHANLSFAVLVAQVLLLVSFHCQPGTVSGPLPPL